MSSAREMPALAMSTLSSGKRARTSLANAAQRGRVVDVEWHADQARSGRRDLLEQGLPSPRDDDAVATIVEGLGECAADAAGRAR